MTPTLAHALEPIGVDLLGGLRALPTQTKFLQSNAQFKDYQGPFGSGKTEVLVWQAIILCTQIPNNRGLIGRFSYPELRDTTRKRFMEICPEALVKNARIPETGDGYVEFITNSVVLFRNLDNAEKYGSLSLGFFGIDEGSESPESVWNYLDGRVGRHWNDLRIPKDRHPYSPGYTVGNPGGRDWRWKRFHSDKRLEGYLGFTPMPRENEANLPPNYYERLSRGKPAWWVARYVLGKMGAMQGLVWPVWDDTLHIVRPFPIPRHWRRLTGHDHGKNNPTACLWTAVDLDGNLISFREYESSGPTIKEHVKHILAMERRHGDQIERRLADPSMFTRMVSVDRGGQAGDKWWSVALEYEQNGLDLEPGDNAMLASLERVNALLWPDPGHRFPVWHPRAGQLGSPHWFFFDSLERTAECMSKWRFKEHATEALGLREEPVDVDDHLPDCARYISTAFVEPSVDHRPKPEPTHREWQVERKKRIGREIRRSNKDESDVEYEEIY